MEDELGGLPLRFAVCLRSSGRMVLMVLDLFGLNIADLVTKSLPLITDGFRSTVVSLFAVVGFVEGRTRSEVPGADSRCSSSLCRVDDLVTGLDFSASTLLRITNTYLRVLVGMCPFDLVVSGLTLLLAGNGIDSFHQSHRNLHWIRLSLPNPFLWMDF